MYFHLSTSRFRLTFEVLTRHLWLLAAILDSKGLRRTTLGRTMVWWGAMALPQTNSVTLGESLTLFPQLKNGDQPAKVVLSRTRDTMYLKHLVHSQIHRGPDLNKVSRIMANIHTALRIGQALF